MEAAGPFTRRKALAGFLSLGLSVALTAVTLWVMHRYLTASFPGAGAVSHSAGSGSSVSETEERLQFLSGLVLMPAFLLVNYSLFRRWCGRLDEGAVSTAGRWGGWGGIAGFLGLLAAGLVQDRGFAWGRAMGQGTSLITWATVSISLLATLALCLPLFRAEASPRLQRASREAGRAFHFLALGLILLVGTFCVIRLRDVTRENVFLFSFNAVFHPMVQVHLGRELLVDLMPQYGLFPHLVEPLFRVVGLSVFSFSLLMGLLNLAAFLGVYRFLRAVLLNRLLAGLTMIAILFNCYFFGRSGNFDHFFQYYPVRFLFPALFVPLTWRYFARGERKVYHLAFLLAAVAVLWNTDTGLVVWLSWMLALLFHEAASRRFARIPGHLLLGLGTLAGTVALFSLALFLRYGHVPNLREFFFYQRLYYLAGYGMMPMTLVHPWNVVLLVYAAGLLYAVMHLVEGKASPKAASVFFLSVLGCGIFSYFQGRSDDGNLLMVAYPAIILAAIFADGLLPRAHGARDVAPVLLVALFTFTLAFSLVGMARVLPAFSRVIAGRLQAGRGAGETDVMRAARFVRVNTRPGEEVLIISYLSSVYHLESRTLAPRGVPSLSESLAGTGGRAFRTLWENVKHSNKVILACDWDLDPVRVKMIQSFKIVAWTDDAYMTLFLPRH